MNLNITTAWEEYGHYAIVVSLGLALVVLVATIRRATSRRTTTKDRDVLSNIVTLMVLILTAEGMFWVLTTKLAMPLPWWLAIFVCAVAEGLMVNFFRLAKDFQQRHGRPGPFGTAFWIVAIAEGAIVALASTNIVEIALRILLPLGVALLHWIKLTAESSQENKGRFLWTPLNLLIRVGAWKPGKITVDAAEARRFEEKLTYAAYTLAASSKWRLEGKRRRVRRMMLKADPATAAAVISHLELAYGIEARITAVVAAGKDAVQIAGGTPTSETTTDTQTIPLPNTNGHRHNGNGLPTATVDGQWHNGHQVTGIPARRAVTAVAMTTAERDADIVIRHWDSLTGLIQAGTLCRSAIERACTVGEDKVLARQAKRVLDIVTCAHSLNSGTPVAERVDTAIKMIANGQS